LCFSCLFSLDRIFAVVYIAPSDSGDREFGERMAHSPLGGRNTVSRNLPGTIETSRRNPSTPRRRRSQRCGEVMRIPKAHDRPTDA